jgi:hypothetical protein
MDMAGQSVGLQAAATYHGGLEILLEKVTEKVKGGRHF